MMHCSRGAVRISVFMAAISRTVTVRSLSQCVRRARIHNAGLQHSSVIAMPPKVPHRTFIASLLERTTTPAPGTPHGRSDGA
jgi:hypothetical protein